MGQTTKTKTTKLRKAKGKLQSASYITFILYTFIQRDLQYVQWASMGT